MPRAADGLANHKPFGERPVIMAAMGVDRENSGGGTHHKDVLIADMPEQQIILEVARLDTCREIGAGGLVLLFRHVDVLPRVESRTGPCRPPPQRQSAASRSVPREPLRPPIIRARS